MMGNDVRYDRQLRLWGDHGQISIGEAKICIFGSSALACEILKNLILAGIQSFMIVDSAIVQDVDLGNNFFVHEDDLMHHRASVTLRYLQSLNPSVRGECDLRTAELFMNQSCERLKNYNVVIATNILESTARSINQILYNENIPFIYSRCYGLLGCVQTSFKEHTVFDCLKENAFPDLRIDIPFDALANLSSNFDLDSLSRVEHSHVPYLLLYMKALELWRSKNEDGHCSSFPDNYAKRKDFQEVYWSMRWKGDDDYHHEQENFIEGRSALIRSLRKTTIPEEVQKLLKHPKAIDPDQSHFWIFVAALRRYTKVHCVLPVSGEIPDMMSDTQSYLSLVSIYRQKALEDAEEVFGHLCAILEKKKLPADAFKFDECVQFCKRAAMLRGMHGELVATSADCARLRCILTDVRECSFERRPVSNVIQVPPAVWYLMLRAADRFFSDKYRYPGTEDVAISADVSDLKAHLLSVVNDIGVLDSAELIEKIPISVIEEVCRYGCAEIHVIAAFIGGIVAQEAIKLVTHQFIPIDNMLIYDGHSQKAAVYSL